MNTFDLPAKKCILNKVMRQCDVYRQFTNKVNVGEGSCIHS
jgi:hypothetical protein